MPIRIYSKERDERRMIIILYFGTLVLMLILLYATYSNIRQLGEANSDLRRYDSALIKLAEVRLDALVMDNAISAYLLSADTAHLGVALGVKERFTHQRRELDSLLATPSWAAQLKALYKAVDRTHAQIGHLRDVDVQQAGQQAHLAFLERERPAREGFRAMHDSTMATLQRARRPMVAEQRIDGFSTPIMLLLYSALAIAATALLFWRVSHALSSTERAKLDLQLKLKELDAEIKKRSSIQTLLQRVLDTSPNGIMTFAAVRDGDGHIVDFEFLSTNRQADLMVGRHDLIGKRLLEEMPENRDSGLFDAYVQVVESGIAYRNEFFYEGEGLATWFSNHAVRLEDGFMVTFADVTENRRAQEVNAEADRIALTSQITRTVAHEVRNPLTNIQLAAEQLHDEVEELEEDVRPFFDIIDRNVKRIGTLINDMLESSKKRELNLVPCSFEDLVGRSLEQVSDRLDLKHVKSTVTIAPDLPEVLADCELMNMAITNIAINAVEAMAEEHGLLRIDVHRAGEDVLVEIADNGKGIPPEDLARLFEPFYSGRPGGLGLGLTTARNILNGHQVRMEVRSNPGEGTTFILRFPKGIFVELSTA